MSASGCSSPTQPTRYGPRRCCDEGGDLALGQHQHRGRDLQREEDDDDQDDVGDRDRRRDEVEHGLHASLVRSHRRGAAVVGGRRDALLDVGLVLVPEVLDGADAPARSRRRRTDTASCRRCCCTRSAAGRCRASRRRRARSCRGSCRASRRLRGTACTCRTTRACRSGSGSWPPRPCRWSRPSRCMAAEPSIVPAATSASKLAWVSSLSGRITLTDDPPGMIALICAVVADAAGVVVDQLAQRDAHVRLVGAGALDVAADAEQLRALVLLRPDGREPRRRRAR